MSIHRQHDKTIISELSKKKCEKLLAVAESLTSAITFMYMMVEGVWHRFYIDCSVLFWDEGIPPDAEEDLSINENYYNIIEHLNMHDNEIAHISMDKGQLIIKFLKGKEIRLTEEEEEVYLKL